jgi:hypothetical protein
LVRKGLVGAEVAVVVVVCRVLLDYACLGK